MSIGTAIFLSVILLCLTILFAATKESWNWKKIVRWGFGITFILTASGSLAVFAFSHFTSIKKPLERFYNVSLRTSEKDVRFMKGEPTKIDSNDQWTYEIKNPVDGQTDGSLIVKFRDGSVRYIMYIPNGYDVAAEHPFGIFAGSTIDLVEATLGKASFVSESDNGAARLYSYANYNTFFGFSKGVVEIYGLYDPATGPMKISPQK